MKIKVNFDSRWGGEHGIGRFAREIEKRNPEFIRINSRIKPSSPADIFFTTLYVTFHSGIYFSPGYNAPLFFLKKTILTVHDLNHIDVDHNSNLLKKIYYRFVLRRACRRSRKIFTVSEFSKKRICEWADIPSSQVDVVGNGVSEEFNPNIKPYEGKYILVVGNRKRHKNELRALKAFSIANIPKDINLLFTGEQSEELESYISNHNLQDRVFFMGRVDNNKLASLYKGARMLLFPSLYEGFGLPVIEAMACGTPVITSNTTSLPEVSGDAAILVDPLNINEIKAAIESLNFDSELCSKLIKRGLERAKMFSWENTAEKIKKGLDNSIYSSSDTKGRL
ncbi:TPA: glycosyltransferase family 4 protein [Raoultella planticola]